MRARRVLASLVLCAVCGAAFAREDAPTEKPVRLPRYEVNERAFGEWGVALEYDSSLLNLLMETAPARGPYTVRFVIRDSPAHRAGLSAGDQVIAAEGRPCEEIAIREMRKLFYETESGKPLTLRVRAPLSSNVREVMLKPDRNTAWRQRKPVRYVYWSIEVVHAPQKELRTAVRWTKAAARRAELEWHGPSLYLAPRDDGSVEWWRRRGPRTTIPAGSVVELHDDGTFTVQPPAS
ncbi:MAG TPA: PDZ domain-containing protein [Acidobacteriota bacterium]|nr:PDZ domain-containing protein [Acidobacteriota bacterium]